MDVTRDKDNDGMLDVILYICGLSKTYTYVYRDKCHYGIPLAISRCDISWDSKLGICAWFLSCLKFVTHNQTHRFGTPNSKLQWVISRGLFKNLRLQTPLKKKEKSQDASIYNSYIAILYYTSYTVILYYVIYVIITHRENKLAETEGFACIYDEAIHFFFKAFRWLERRNIEKWKSKTVVGAISFLSVGYLSVHIYSIWILGIAKNGMGVSQSDDIRLEPSGESCPPAQVPIRSGAWS